MNRIANTLGLVIGILGIVLSIYFYYSTKENRIISYNLSSTSFKIFDNDLIKGSQKVTLFRNDSVKIKENVYLLTFAIWNSGNATIDPNDIRKDIIVKFNGIKEILDYSIIKEIDPEISKFNLEQISNSAFHFKWLFFDPNDGLKIQVLYLGGPNVNTEINGKILNTEFKEFIPLRDKKYSLTALFLGSFILIFLSFMVFNFYRSKRFFIFNKFESKDSFKNVFLVLKIFYVVLFFAYLILIPICFYRYFFQSGNVPF